MPPTQNSSFSTQHPKRPLYIGHRTLVALDDGPSLVLSKAHLVNCRYPLQRVSRLIIDFGVQIQADAITACLAADIPLTWRNRDGCALAVALPLQGREQDMRERIAIMMARKDWQSCYQAWVAAQHNIALRALSRRFNTPMRQGKTDMWIDYIWRQYGIRKHWAMHLLQAWQAITVALIIEYWRRLDMPVEMLSSTTDGWNVLQDMADCLVLDMVVELVWRKKKWQRLMRASRSEIDFFLIQAFERRQVRLLKLLDAMHARFHRWLLDMEPWR